MTDWNSDTAEWYAKKYGEYPTNRLAGDALSLTADSVIVDVGCGTGSALRHAASRVPKGDLIGVDPVPRMIELAREHTAEYYPENRIQFRLGSAEDLPVDDALADFVFSFDSFDHWQNKEEGLAEVRRVLTSDGTFVVVKDGGVPGGKMAKIEFLNSAVRAGFVLLSEKQISSEGIDFSMWIFTRSPQHNGLTPRSSGPESAGATASVR